MRLFSSMVQRQVRCPTLCSIRCWIFTIYDLRFTIYDLQIMRSGAAGTAKQMRTHIRKAVIGRSYKGAGAAKTSLIYNTPDGLVEGAHHTCPNKIFSGLIQPIPRAFPMDEEVSQQDGKPLTIRHSDEPSIAPHRRLPRATRANLAIVHRTWTPPGASVVHRRHFVAYGSAISRVAR